MIYPAEFELACARLLDHEGGYVNDPDDPGGETKWGISKRSYPALNIARLDRDMAKAIYYQDFWKPLGDGAHPAIRFQTMDFAIHSGLDTAIRKLQRAVGAADDGRFGPVSRARLNNTPVSDVLLLLLAERLEYLTNLHNWPKYARGWSRRIAKNLRYAAIDNEV